MIVKTRRFIPKFLGIFRLNYLNKIIIKNIVFGKKSQHGISKKIKWRVEKAT